MSKSMRNANMAPSQVIDLGQDREPEPKEHGMRNVLAVLAAMATIASALIIGGQVGRRSSSAPPTPPPSATGSAPVSTPSAINSPAQVVSTDLVTSVARLVDQLRFVPLLPAPAPSAASAQREGCGVASSWCLAVHSAPSGATTSSVEILEGPAGCCLDGVRGSARRSTDVEVQAGVWAHWEDFDARFGGPILWWVDTRSAIPVYVAVSAPLGDDRDALVRIARSLVPMSASP